MDYVIYCRVSSVDQNVRQQALFVRDWMDRQGLNFVKVVLDEESGRKALVDRENFRWVLEYIRDKGFGLVVYNLDRLTRNWDDVTFIERFFRDNWSRCPLLSTSDLIDFSNASGRLMFRIRMATSCYMPEDMFEKQKIGIDRARREGKYRGGVRGRTWKRN